MINHSKNCNGDWVKSEGRKISDGAEAWEEELAKLEVDLTIENKRGETANQIYISNRDWNWDDMS